MKMKQLMAAALSAAMVLGGSLTAFAAAPTYTLKSSTEASTGQTAPMETIKIGDDTYQARVLNKTDQLIYSNVKAENMIFSSWEVKELYPNEEGGTIIAIMLDPVVSLMRIRWFRFMTS